MTHDQLVEIESKDWLKLKNLYTSENLKKYVSYMTIDNYIRWLEQDLNLKHVKSYSLNGDFSDGTFIVIDRCHAYADTIDASNGNLAKLLQLVDYTQVYMISCIRPELHPILLDILKKKNVEIVFEDVTLLYHLLKENALQFDVQPPMGITLRPITEQRDYEKADSVWSLYDTKANSLAYFQRMGKFNPNVGAFKDDGTLVAIPTGLHCALQTYENHYGHGYGSLVAKYVSRKISETGHDVFSNIFEHNKASRSLYGKLGFREVDKVHWIGIKNSWTPTEE